MFQFQRIPNIQKVKMVSCGAYFTVCVAEGFLWSFGKNSFGQLGTGDTTRKNKPTKIVGIPFVQSVTCGSDHTLILTNGNNLWSCGDNRFGQLCTGNTNNIFKPQQTPFSNITKISAGKHFSLFQDEEGKIYGCGNNLYGQLGLDHFEHPQISVWSIPDQPHNIVQFCCGLNHSLFLDEEGNVYSVGYNKVGCLGLGDTVNRMCLNKIPNLPKIQTISCVGSSSYLIDEKGNIWSFGKNVCSQLGHGSAMLKKLFGTTNINVPTKIENFSNIIQISYGCTGDHFLAKDFLNKIFVMGNNNSGQLGSESTWQIFDEIPIPEQMDAKYFEIWCKVNKNDNEPIDQFNKYGLACATGYAHTVTLSDKKIAYSFGYNMQGQLGLGYHNYNPSVPNPIKNLSEIKLISCGGAFTVCVDYEGSIWSFGNNASGQLGIGNTTNHDIPQKIQDFPPVQSISCGGFHFLCVTYDLNLWTCGCNKYGQLCLDEKIQNDQSLLQQTSFSNISKVSAGYYHSLFQNNKGIYACGYNSNGELGVGNFQNQKTPRLILNQPQNIVQFCCGYKHSLFLDMKGNVYSVGKNKYGQLGLGHFNNTKVLNRVLNIQPIRTISCVGSSSYLIDFNEEVWSFGKNENGQLGHGNSMLKQLWGTRNINVPTKIKNLSDIIQISYGCTGDHFLAKNSKSNIFVLGNNTFGQLGTSDYTNSYAHIRQISFTTNEDIWGNLLNNNEENINENVKSTDNANTNIQPINVQAIEQSRENNRILQSKNILNIWKHIQFKSFIEQNLANITPDSFENITLLGKGSNGLVMKCDFPWEFRTNQMENFQVALKMIMNLTPSDTREHLTHSKNEFDILSDSALQLHPNIIRMLGSFDGKPTEIMLGFVEESVRDLCYRADTGKLKGVQFFMLEYYEKTLQTVIKNENSSKETIINYAVQISRALLHLYESKIAHLDMKLNNIMISGTNEIVVVDFGCAAKLDNSFEFELGLHVHPGNPSHLAPEVLLAVKHQQKKIPCRDQFSWELGVLLFEMLAKGSQPWDTSPNLQDGPDLTAIPEEFHWILNQLLCSRETRLSIVDAWRYLEELSLTVTPVY